MNHDMETPSIVVEPPREEFDHEAGQLNSSTLQVLFGPFAGTTSSPMGNDCAEQGLFSSPIDQTQLSISPLITAGLRDGNTMDYLNIGSPEFEGTSTATSANVFLSPSGQNSPIEALSPASTSSGDLFPDSWSDCSSNWSPSHDSSPSSPSLSPINTGLLNFSLSDQAAIMGYLEENSSFQQSGGIQRVRSNSYSGSSDPQPEGSQRPRSASFTNINDFFPGNTQQLHSPWDNPLNDTALPHTDSLTDFSIHDVNFYPVGSDPHFCVPSSPSLGYPSGGEPWGVPEVQTASLPPPMYNFAPPEGPLPNHNQMLGAHSRSQSTHLTVPPASTLQRRSAHRRSHSHTGIHDHGGSPVPPNTPYNAMTRGSFPSRRGRSPVRSPVIPSHSRHSSASSHSRRSSTSSTQEGQYGYPLDNSAFLAAIVTDTSSFLSPALSPSPSSATQSPLHSPHSISSIPLSDFIGAEAMPTICVDDSLVRRHTLAGSSGSQDREEGSSSGVNVLHRAASDPIGKGRNKSRPSKARYPGLLRPQKEVDDANQFKDLEMILDVPVEGITSPSSATSPSSDGDLKGVVASTKIVGASVKRRKDPAKQGRFVCHLCGNNFTAKHNLLNHMNSHNGIKPFKCTVCNQTFTTNGTAKRHQNQCTGKQARKRS